MTAALLIASAMFMAPSKVQITPSGSGYSMTLNGKPFLIKGVGGTENMAALKAAGGNAVRTWGVDRLAQELDEAQKHGLMVCAGIWLGHERHGFKYDDPAQVAAQKEAALAAVRKYKDHPALLMWGLGNEMEGFADGGSEKIWRAIEDIAREVKRIDPNHPTMTVTAEIGALRVPSINEIAKSIDIHGINSYGGASSVIERYRKAGGRKPVVFTEFGPIGPWEAPKTAWNAPIEPTSTAKGEMYRRHYMAAVTNSGGLSLGSFAFLWGNKQEATATWFGMKLKDGSMLAAAEVMEEMWTGKKSKNLVPRINQFALGKTTLGSGESLAIQLEAMDPEKGELKGYFEIRPESTDRKEGGDQEAEPTLLTKADFNLPGTIPNLKAPAKPGNYRVFVYLRDGSGNAATGNVPFQVK